MVIDDKEIAELPERAIEKHGRPFGKSYSDQDLRWYDLASGTIDVINESPSDGVTVFASSFGPIIVQIVDPEPIDTRTIAEEINRFGKSLKAVGGSMK